VAENSKELCEPSTADPSENAPIVGEDAVSTQKDEVAPATAVDAPIADGEFFIYFFFFFVSLYHFLTVLKALSFLCLCFDSVKTLRLSKLEDESFVLFYFILGDTPNPISTVDKPRSSFSSWSVYQKRNPASTYELSTPWCKLLSQSAQVGIVFLVFL